MTDGVAGAAGGFVDRLVARAYGLTYDAVVRGFPPYEALIAEILDALDAARSPRTPRSAVRVLDVACGTGIAARRLAAAGYAVTALEPVPHLARVAARRLGGSGVTVRAGDVADGAEAAGAFDAVVSLHTLTWHPAPARLLAGCHRVLRPGGAGVLLTYRRPAGPATLREVRIEHGLLAGVRAARWVGPTMLFEAFRAGRRRYVEPGEFERMLALGGFAILHIRPTFLGGISLLSRVRRK